MTFLTWMDYTAMVSLSLSILLFGYLIYSCIKDGSCT